MSRSNARNQKISDDEWDMRKEYIRHLYLVDNLPLNRVLDELAQTGFIVSKHQLEYRCKTKWGFDKNLSAADWKDLGRRTTPHQNPDSLQVYVKGQLLDPNKTKRGITRKRPQDLRRPKQSRGNKVQSIAIERLISGAQLDIRVTVMQDMFRSMCSRLSAPEQSVRHANSYVNIGADEINIIVQFVSNGLIEGLLGSPVPVNFSIQLQWLYDLTRILTSGRVDKFSNKVKAVVEVALEGAVRMFHQISFSAPYRHDGTLTDQQDTYIYEIVQSLYGLCRQNGTPEFQDGLWNASLTLGHVDACSFVLEQSESHFAASIPSESWTLEPLVREGGRGKLHLLQKLVKILPKEKTYELMRAIIDFGEVADFTGCLAILDEAMLVEMPEKRIAHTYLSKYNYPVRSLLTWCILSYPPSMALEKTRGLLDEYCRRGAIATARSLGADALVAAAREGHNDLFEYLQTTLDIHPSEPNRDGISALHTVSLSGNVDFFQRLLGQYHSHLDPKQAINTYLSAFYASFKTRNFDFCDVLEDHMGKLSAGPIDWRAHLCSCGMASSQSNTDLYDWTVGGCTFKAKRCLLCSRTWKACSRKDSKQLAFCLNHGADHRLRRPADASTAGCIQRDSVQLLDEVVNGNSRWAGDIEGRTCDPLSCAKLLLKQGLRLAGGETIAAVRSGNLGLVRLMKAADTTNVGELAGDGTTLLEAAILGGDMACIEYVRRLDHMGNTYESRALCAAVSVMHKHSDLVGETFDHLLSQRAFDKQADIFEGTAIGLLAFSGDVDRLFQLLQVIRHPPSLCVGPPNLDEHTICPPEDNQPPPILEDGYFFDEERLDHDHRSLSFWADAQRPKCSPIALGVFSRKAEIISILLDRGVRPDGLSISLACLSQQHEILSLLLRDQPDLGGWSLMPGVAARPPLVYAAQNSDLTALTQLLSVSADINDGGQVVRDEWTTRTPLQTAATVGNMEVVTFLLEKGANIHAAADDYRGATALQYASMFGHLDVVTLLIKHGAHVNEPPARSNGMTFLQSAAISRQLDMLDLAISLDVAVDGPHRVYYIMAVASLQSFGRHILARRLQAYGGWTAVDEEIARLQRSRLQPHDEPEPEEDICKHFGWESIHDMNTFQGRSQLQAWWDAATNAQNAGQTSLGLLELARATVTEQIDPLDGLGTGDLSTAMLPVFAVGDPWLQLSPSVLLDSFEDVENFNFTGSTNGGNQGLPIRSCSVNVALDSFVTELPPDSEHTPEDNEAEVGDWSAALCDPIDSLEFDTWGYDLF